MEKKISRDVEKSDSSVFQFVLNLVGRTVDSIDSVTHSKELERRRITRTPSMEERID